MPSEQQHTWERTSSLGYQVNHLARLLAQALRVRIEPHGVVPGQFAQLLALYEEDGLTQRDLCARVRIDQSTMAHTLMRMERDDLIVREPDPDDGRRAIITVTAHGRELEQTLIGAATAVNALATRGVDPDDVSICMTVIDRLIANLQDAVSIADSE